MINQYFTILINLLLYLAKIEFKHHYHSILHQSKKAKLVDFLKTKKYFSILKHANVLREPH